MLKFYLEKDYDNLTILKKEDIDNLITTYEEINFNNINRDITMLMNLNLYYWVYKMILVPMKIFNTNKFIIPITIII